MKNRILLLAALFSLSCSTSTRWDDFEIKYDAANLSADERAALAQEAQADWGKRQDTESLQRALKSFEKLANADAGQYDLEVLLARGYYLLGWLHHEQLSDQREAWRKGVYWGQRANANPHGPDNRVGALYWTALNMDRWSEDAPTAKRLKYQASAQELMKAVEKTNQNYNHGGVFRYWGEFYANQPFIGGGGLDRSYANFGRSLLIGNDFLLNHVQLAEEYAVRKKNPELFERHLNFVLNVDPSRLRKGLAEALPEQILAKKRAQELMSQKDQLFKP